MAAVLPPPQGTPYNAEDPTLAWKIDFPGDTHLLSILRDNVAAAESLLKQARRAFIELHHELDTLAPMHIWEEELRLSYLFLRDHQSHFQCEFHRHLQALQTAYSAHLLNEKIKSEIPPPLLVAPEAPVELRQNLKVDTESGQVTTISDFPAEEVWKGQPWPDGYEFSRDFFFPDAVIPEPYSWVLTHEGVTHQPTRFISIVYSQQEFLRLCKLEIDTKSQFVLDGERLRASRRD